MSATEFLRTMLLAPAVVVATLVVGFADAQAAAITDADIERAKRNQPTVSDADIQRARERHRMPSDSELRQVPAPSTPRIDALPRPAARTPLDLGALAGGFDTTNQLPLLPTKPGPRMLVFISLSMPEAALSRLVDQAARADATLLLRGLANGSLTQTVARVQALIGHRRVAVQIDPQAFDRYAVAQAPSFVLVRDGTQPSSCSSGVCVPGNGYVMVAGDVSLDYALSFLRRSAPAFAQDADTYLQRLKPALN